MKELLVPVLITGLGTMMLFMYQAGQAATEERFDRLETVLKETESRLTTHDEEQASHILQQHNQDMSKLYLEIAHLKEFRDDMKIRWQAREAREAECDKERKDITNRLLHIEHLLGDK